MKPQTLGNGHLWVLMSPWGMNLKLYMKYFIYWTVDVTSSKLLSSQLWTQFYGIAYIGARKIQDFNVVWTRDIAMPVRRSNQLSYEATDPVEVLNFLGLYRQLNCGNLTLINSFDAKCWCFTFPPTPHWNFIRKQLFITLNMVGGLLVHFKVRCLLTGNDK